jgi:hypothetical protein
VTYPVGGSVLQHVHDVHPPLQTDTLEDGEPRPQDVVKTRGPKVGVAEFLALGVHLRPVCAITPPHRLLRLLRIAFVP